ncbi:MAG: RidA family protein [Rhodospirillales bacterium]|nr:RidA family protein [Rhodospirillales bacterium]
MSGKIDARLKELGINLASAAAPAGNYVPWVKSGNLVFISGQITIKDGKIEFVGKLGREFRVEEGQKAARLCAINILTQLKAACGGDLEKVKRCVRVGGFVNAVPDFANHPEVINGASDLIVEVFGDAGKHARAAVGVGSLPRDVAVEVEAVFEVA